LYFRFAIIARIKYTSGTAGIPVIRSLVYHHVILLSSSDEGRVPVISVQSIASVQANVPKHSTVLVHPDLSIQSTILV